MRRRGTVRNVVEYCLAQTLLKSVQWSPMPLAAWLSRRYIALLDLVAPRLRQAAYRNLSFALPGADAKVTTDAVFDSLARVLLSFAKFPTMRRENISQWIRCEGIEHFEAARRAGRGVLVATGHLGNWELSAFAHAWLTAPMHFVVRPLDNPLLDRLIQTRRELSGNRSLGKRDSVRVILKALAANEAVGILIDQNWTADTGVFVDFFGKPACSDTGFAKLAAHTGAAVVPGFALWSAEERRYVLRFYPSIPITGDAARDTAAIQSAFEAIVRAHPGEWLWIHRRWKTRPQGESSLY
ncbi:MAG TPA: lysophospholipid acyltransferase family protein [Bryobacteraceae bacterium]|nr:lysophospholipid acyltransferase family protein [Bryobacteraceae bacterium]